MKPLRLLTSIFTLTAAVVVQNPARAEESPDSGSSAAPTSAVAAADGGTLADAPKLLQVPTGAFFGTITGTIAWPKGAAVPKDKQKACAAVTVSARQRTSEASKATETEPAKYNYLDITKAPVPASGSFAKECSFKIEKIPIRKDIELAATLPTDLIKGCATTVSLEPAKGATWTNPIKVPNSSQPVKADMAIKITCAKDAGKKKK